MGLTDGHMVYGDDIEEGKKWSLYDKGYNDGIAKSLKVWEKVKEEIEKASKIAFSKLHWSESAGLNMAINIIDKHLQEVK